MAGAARTAMRTMHFLPWVMLLGATACVSTGKYDAAVTDASKAKAALNDSRAEATRLRSESTSARGDAITCQRSLDDATAVNQELHAELARSGKDADQLLAAKGALASSLEQAKARLEELRRAQAAADARSALFRELALKLKRMIDAGDLSVILRSGRMVVVLPNDVLFDSGRASVNAHGREMLAQLATALATFRGRRFQVAGHTDNEPIRYSGFHSNWDLSAERALAVVGLLIQGGMPEASLSAAGYGEFDPVGNNTAPEGRAKNRRIEITLQPNIDELVAVPGWQN
jgi:chemotaxis protein MotB